MRIAADIFLRTIFKKMLLYLLESEIEKEKIDGLGDHPRFYKDKDKLHMTAGQMRCN